MSSRSAKRRNEFMSNREAIKEAGISDSLAATIKQNVLLMCKLFLGTRNIPSKDLDEEKLLTLDPVGLMVCGISTTSRRS